MQRANRIRLGAVRTLCACWWIVVTVLLLTSNPASLVGLSARWVSAWSAVAHVGSFLLLSGLTLASCPPLSMRATLALLATYGVTVELLQGLVPNRHVSLSDFAANLLGIAMGAIVYAAAKMLWRRRTQSNGCSISRHER
jgi:VanZ family protein